MTIRITQKNIGVAPNGLHRLDDCLYLRVTDSGRSFVFRYQKDGKRKDVGLGSAAKVTIARAREIALKLRTDIAQGIEPPPKKKAERPAAPVEVKRERTFNEIYAEAIEVTRQSRQWKSNAMQKDWISSIERFACPVIGDKALSKVSREDIVTILEPIWYKQTPTAARLRARIEQVFSYALFKHEYEGQNPALWRGNLDMLLPMSAKIHTRKHHEAITLEEAKRVAPLMWKTAHITDLAILFILLTALRRTEVIQMLWGEVKFDERTFYVAPERRKIFRDYPHRVPLSDQALLLLRFVRSLGRKDCDKVFESRFVKDSSIKGDFLPRVLSAYVGRRVTVHGCRATFRMWAEDAQEDVAAAEYEMMHENPSEVVRAYQRSDLLDRRRVLMQKWADEILPLDVMKSVLKEKGLGLELDKLDKLDEIPV